MNFLFSISILLLYLLVACTDQSYVAEKEKSQSGELSDENIFKGYETTLDRAKDAERTIMDAAKQRQKEMEDQNY